MRTTTTRISPPLLFALVCIVAAQSAYAELPYTVTLEKESEGWILRVDGEPLPINGVVWSFTPIGENYNYDLWEQDERYIRRVIDTDARLMKEIGVTAVRLFSTIPPKWVSYLYRRHGIYTIINDLMARYGYSVDGRWYPNTDYSLPRLRELVREDARNTIETFKDVPGVLAFMYGNENNYGLQWKSNEIENLPVGERVQTRAQYLYSLFGEVVDLSKELTDLPVGIINGDTQYLSIIAEEVPNLDIFGINIYRGARAESILFESVAELLDKPILYTEFGADAWNAALQEEDGYNQARFLKSQWREIYEQAYGQGKSQNIIGGIIFQWMDEWWKYGLETDLFIHNTEGTWRQPAYYDGTGGRDNNMNEEWWGIIAQSPEKQDGINRRIPRPAFYTMAEIWKQSLYKVGNSAEIAQHFDAIIIEEQVARADSTAIRHQLGNDLLQLSGSLHLGARGHFSDQIDQIQHDAVDFSYTGITFVNIGVNPAEDFEGEITLRAQLGALDDVFVDSYPYHISAQGEGFDRDRRGRYSGIDRLPLELYSAALRYDDELLRIEGYFHDGITLPGHPDLILEGDFFGIYPETFDIDGMDLNLSKAPFGVEFVGKRGVLQGLTLFIGPEIYHGAPPAAYIKYYRELIDNLYLGLLHYEEFRERYIELQAYDSGDNLRTVAARPELFPERKSSLYLGYTLPDLGPLSLIIEGAALMAGTEDLGREYISSDGTTNAINILDTLSGKGRLTFNFDTTPVFNLVAEYTYAGRVANGRAFIPRAGSQITEGGGANRHEVVASGNVYIGDFLISPKFRWRTPVDGPITNGTLRNPLTSPFYVWGENRGLMQAELLFTYDQTGATWFYEWNNDDREDAEFAISLGALYTIYQDITDPGYSLFNDSVFYGYGAWPTGMPRAENLFRIRGRVVSNFAPQMKIIATIEGGLDQNLGNPDLALEYNASGDIALKLEQFQIGMGLDWNVWGPEDWHYEFGIIIPWQWQFLFAYHFGNFSFIEPENRIGLLLEGRWFEDAREVMPINLLGSTTDRYRLSLTLFYELSY